VSTARPVLSRVALAALAGGLTGLLWWLLYRPLALPVLPLVAVHAAGAVLLERLFSLLGERGRGWAPLGLALFIGAVCVPAWLASFHDVGLFAGVSGHAIDVASFLLGTALGAGIGLLRGWPRPVLAAAVVLGLAGSGWLVGADHGSGHQPKAAAAPSFSQQPVAVIGIDGADWSVLEPMLEQGRLPALQDLLEGGRHGVLASIEPYYSPIVWTSIFSGQVPEVHGLDDWYRADARNRRVPMLWDIFGANGRSSLTVNVPGSWPPADVEGGVLLAGFPIPGIVTGAKGQLLGLVLSNGSDTGPVETRPLRAQGEGRFETDVQVAMPHLRPRLPGISHRFIDLALRKLLLPVRGVRLRFEVQALSGRVRFSGGPFDQPTEVAQGDATGWLRLETDDCDALLRIHVLQVAADTVQLYVLPALQAPDRPRYELATGVERAFFEQRPPYIAEGVGWEAFRDPRVAALLPDELFDVERSHLEATLRLLDRQVPDLLVHVITATDRVQHPFWSLYEPQAFPEDFDFPDGLEGRQPVQESFEQADQALAAILERLPADTLVFVVSDHGFQAQASEGIGWHRREGVWLAHGPMVPADPEPLELNAVDIVPTILRCSGAPVAGDLDGQAADAICPGQGDQTVASYRLAETEEPQAEARIDASRQEQLRSLGYIE